jgi:hypothetical protein
MNPEEYLDKIIIEYNYHSDPSILIIIEKYLDHKFNHLNKDDNHLLTDIQNLIEEYKYGNQTGMFPPFFNIADSWKEAKKLGGHFNYQMYLKNENINAKKRIEDSDKLIKSQLKDIPVNSKFRKGQYYVAIIAILLTIIIYLLNKLNKN